MDHFNSIAEQDCDNSQATMINFFVPFITHCFQTKTLMKSLETLFVQTYLMTMTVINISHLLCTHMLNQLWVTHSFLHHILLSMGQFDKEVDLLMYDSISDAFRYAKLIGQHNDSESLQRYSNKLLEKWITSQLRTLATWVVVAGNLFDQIIVQNE